MFKRILKALSLIPLMLGMVSFAQTVHTPTLEGTYNWSGTDIWPYGHLLFSSTPSPCPTGEVVRGLNADFSPVCIVSSAGSESLWFDTVAVTQLAGDTTLVLASVPANIKAPGIFFVDGEYETYSGVSGGTITGISRGAFLTTPAQHNVNAQVVAVPFPAGQNTQAPVGGFFTNAAGKLLISNCGFPGGDNFNGALTTIQANCGANETNIQDNGQIVQHNTGVHNFLAPFWIAPNLANNPTAGYPLPVDNSTNLVQTNGQYQFTRPIGFGAPLYGPVRAVPVPNIPAPSLSAALGGSCSITYEVAGVDVDGNPIPGTPATIAGIYPPGLVFIQTPLVAGIASYDLYRTAVSGSCGGVSVGKFTASVTTAYPFFEDFGGAGDGTIPPAVNLSVAKQCIGSATNPELYCHLSGASSTPPVSCSLSTYGWDYTNTIAATGSNLHCYAGSTTWTVSDGAGGALASINGDSTPAQHIVVSGAGLSVSQPSAGTTQITLSGAAGTGAVSQANYGQIGSYTLTGGTTTIGPATNLYALNPKWTLQQINNLFSRFNLVTFTSYSITSNVLTLNGNNSYSVGDEIVVENFPTSTFLNGFFTLTSASATSVTASLTHADVATTTETGNGTMNAPGFFTSDALVVIPPSISDGPTNAWSNTHAQTFDWRKGYAWQQMSQYGVKCDAKQYYVSLVSGSNLVNVGSDFGTEAVGRTLVASNQTSYNGTASSQWDWEPTITALSGGNITLSSASPVNYTGNVIIGTDNTATLQIALNDLGSGIFPLYIPTGCISLTNTLRWGGQSIIGQSMDDSGFYGFPGRDILQAQDSPAITAWSITSNVATFTINPLNVNEVLVGDVYTLSGFPTSTFFNTQNVTVLSVPTATTFTVAFTHADGSATESGKAAATTNAAHNGMQLQKLNFNVNNSIDPTIPHTHYDSNTAAATTIPAMYRPLQTVGEPTNNPFAPGWGTGAINGVATITANSAVICVPTASGARSPVLGSIILFPYQGNGLYSGTVSSTAGSCSTGFNPFTLSAALPNNAAFTSTQAEWWSYTTVQTLAAAIPSTITYPYTIILTIPFPPIPGYQSNVATHGHLIVGPDQFDYMGLTFGGTAGGTATLTLRRGPTSINGGSGDALGAVVFPLNPCSADFNTPYPVYPTLNGTLATPIGAAFYAGRCGGNAALAFPVADGNNTAFNNAGMSLAHFQDVAGTNTTVNSNSVSSNNGSTLLLQMGNETGYGVTIDDLRVSGLEFGWAQGPAAINESGVRAVLPTSSGQSLSNCTFRTGFPITWVSITQSVINRCDTYVAETSPYDGTAVGATTSLYLAYTRNENDGTGVTGTGQLTIRDWNAEPENGNHDEVPPSVFSDCGNCTFIGSIFEGGYNIFGGDNQHIIGTQMANPVFNYGSNNYFDNLYGLNTTINDANVYNGTLQFYNWGLFSTCSGVRGNVGPQQGCGAGFVQSWNGHDAWSAMFGDGVNPTENILGGMVVPGELSGFGGPVWDSTELYWGSHATCALSTGTQCISSFSPTFNEYIFIGPHQRIGASKYVLKLNVKAESAAMSFRVLLSAQNGASSSCTANYNLSNGTFTANTTWTPVMLPVDFTGYSGCNAELQVDSASPAGTLDVGYVNFIPFNTSMFMPLGTPTTGAVCPIAGQFEVDATHLWICRPTTGAAFGAGTWDYYGTAN